MIVSTPATIEFDKLVTTGPSYQSSKQFIATAITGVALVALGCIATAGVITSVKFIAAPIVIISTALGLAAIFWAWYSFQQSAARAEIDFALTLKHRFKVRDFAPDNMQPLRTQAENICKQYLEKAANRREGEASYQLGILNYEINDFDGVEKWIGDAIEKGHNLAIHGKNIFAAAFGHSLQMNLAAALDPNNPNFSASKMLVIRQSTERDLFFNTSATIDTIYYNLSLNLLRSNLVTSLQDSLALSKQIVTHIFDKTKLFPIATRLLGNYLEYHGKNAFNKDEQLERMGITNLEKKNKIIKALQDNPRRKKLYDEWLNDYNAALEKVTPIPALQKLISEF